MSAFRPEVLGDAKPFLQQLFDALREVRIDVTNYYMDHICYRVATTERYEALKPLLASEGTLLHETMIGGRPIATYKLSKPLVMAGRIIDVVELPAPKTAKPGKPIQTYTEGYEHAEFVIGTEPFAAFVARHPQVAFDLGGADKAVNPELRVALGQLSVKFHQQSLEDVIRWEKRGSVTHP